MQDPRALANPKALESYRTWGQEGARRSGFSAIILGVTTLTPLLATAGLLFKPAGRGGHAWIVGVGAGFALYLAIALCLMVIAVLRLKAWKRAHPWAPPPARHWI